MKIAYVLSRYPTLTETFIRVELQTIIGDGHGLRVYPLRGPQDTAWIVADRPDGGVSACVRRFGFALAPANLGALIGEFVRSPAVFLRAAWRFVRTCPSGPGGALKALFILPKACRIARATRRWGADHVHAHFANLPGAVAALVGRLNGIPCSFTAHAFDIYRRDEASLARLTTDVDFVATISERNRAHFATIVPAEHARKVRIVHCGVDLAEFSAVGPGAGPWVSVGRLIPKKGFAVLIEAMKVLAERGDKTRCLIIGEGKQRRKLEQLITRLGVGDRVELGGPRPYEEVREALAGAGAFVLPCIEARDGDVDGIPVSLMEAMAMQKVVVTTGISGITELVTDGVDGLLVDQNSPVALADALASLQAGELDTGAMGRAARVTVQNGFDCTTNARKLVAMMGRGRNEPGRAEAEATP